MSPAAARTRLPLCAGLLAAGLLTGLLTSAPAAASEPDLSWNPSLRWADAPQGTVTQENLTDVGYDLIANPFHRSGGQVPPYAFPKAVAQTSDGAVWLSPPVQQGDRPTRFAYHFLRVSAPYDQRYFDLQADERAYFVEVYAGLPVEGGLPDNAEPTAQGYVLGSLDGDGLTPPCQMGQDWNPQQRFENSFDFAPHGPPYTSAPESAGDEPCVPLPGVGRYPVGQAWVYPPVYTNFVSSKEYTAAVRTYFDSHTHGQAYFGPCGEAATPSNPGRTFIDEQGRHRPYVQAKMYLGRVDGVRQDQPIWYVPAYDPNDCTTPIVPNGDTFTYAEQNGPSFSMVSFSNNSQDNRAWCSTDRWTPGSAAHADIVRHMLDSGPSEVERNQPTWQAEAAVGLVAGWQDYTATDQAELEDAFRAAGEAAGLDGAVIDEEWERAASSWAGRVEGSASDGVVSWGCLPSLRNVYQTRAQSHSPVTLSWDSISGETTYRELLTGRKAYFGPCGEPASGWPVDAAEKLIADNPDVALFDPDEPTAPTTDREAWLVSDPVGGDDLYHVYQPRPVDDTRPCLLRDGAPDVCELPEVENSPNPPLHCCEGDDPPAWCDGICDAPNPDQPGHAAFCCERDNPADWCEAGDPPTTDPVRCDVDDPPAICTADDDPPPKGEVFPGPTFPLRQGEDDGFVSCSGMPSNGARNRYRCNDTVTSTDPYPDLTEFWVRVDAGRAAEDATIGGVRRPYEVIVSQHGYSSFRCTGNCRGPDDDPNWGWRSAELELTFTAPDGPPPYRHGHSGNPAPAWRLDEDGFTVQPQGDLQVITSGLHTSTPATSVTDAVDHDSVMVELFEATRPEDRLQVEASGEAEIERVMYFTVREVRQRRSRSTRTCGEEETPPCYTAWSSWKTYSNTILDYSSYDASAYSKHIGGSPENVVTVEAVDTTEPPLSFRVFASNLPS